MSAHALTLVHITEVHSISIHRPHELEPEQDEIIKAELEVVVNNAVVLERSYRVWAENVVIPTERLIGLTLLQAEALINGLQLKGDYKAAPSHPLPAMMARGLR